MRERTLSQPRGGRRHPRSAGVPALRWRAQPPRPAALVPRRARRFCAGARATAAASSSQPVPGLRPRSGGRAASPSKTAQPLAAPPSRSRASRASSIAATGGKGAAPPGPGCAARSHGSRAAQGNPGEGPANSSGAAPVPQSHRSVVPKRLVRPRAHRAHALDCCDSIVRDEHLVDGPDAPAGGHKLVDAVETGAGRLAAGASRASGCHRQSRCRADPLASWDRPLAFPSGPPPGARLRLAVAAPVVRNSSALGAFVGGSSASSVAFGRGIAPLASWGTRTTGPARLRGKTALRFPAGACRRPVPPPGRPRRVLGCDERSNR